MRDPRGDAARNYSLPLYSPATDIVDIDEKLLGVRAGPRLRESRLIMSTREVLSNLMLGFVAAGLGAFIVYPLDAVCSTIVMGVNPGHNP